MEQNYIPQRRKSESKNVISSGALAFASPTVFSRDFSFAFLLFGDQCNISVPSFSLASREHSSPQHGRLWLEIFLKANTRGWSCCPRMICTVLARAANTSAWWDLTKADLVLQIYYSVSVRWCSKKRQMLHYNLLCISSSKSFKYRNLLLVFQGRR